MAWTYDIQPGLPLLVLSCSEMKRPAEGFVRFHELYDGPMWQQVRASGYALTNVAAISGLYGFLWPGQKIETYNVKMDEERSMRMCGFGDHVGRFDEAVRLAGNAYVVGGQFYRELAERAIRVWPDLAPRVSFATGSFLEMRKQLGEWLRARKDVP